ncbi:hypothetical protein L1987_01434 [Smallanthus sonchifolius]|uniref:Uncharacterized protein n=1 Tax=Smallanthus sonchifolius TaxID=185202 RepID=A0ACB9K515_9ASTR|nr:hypothetical protein L1987_01434 [Smallanthus sonchifolius]
MPILTDCFFFGNLQHIAASQENCNCVLLLLDYGVDPNNTGRKPSTILAVNWTETQRCITGSGMVLLSKLLKLD